MKTHSITRPDGGLHAFEITSTWVRISPLLELLKSIPGVTDVRRQRYDDDRIVFSYMDIEAVVHEPWGDSNRYWVGFKEPEVSQQVDLAMVKEAFDQYHGLTIFKPKAKRDERGA